MLLFGDYQFGGHRYFGQQDRFAAEDCSSVIGKAIKVGDEELKQFTTRYIREGKSSFKAKTSDLQEGALF